MAISTGTVAKTIVNAVSGESSCSRYAVLSHVAPNSTAEKITLNQSITPTATVNHRDASFTHRDASVAEQGPRDAAGQHTQYETWSWMCSRRVDGSFNRESVRARLRASSPVTVLLP